MPFCLSQNNEFRGIFSQCKILWNTLKQLENIDSDDKVTEMFLIRSENGKIIVNDVSFVKLTYANLCKEIRENTRIAIYRVNEEDSCYGIWETEMNSVYYSKEAIEENVQDIPDQTEIDKENISEKKLEESTMA